MSEPDAVEHWFQMTAYGKCTCAYCMAQRRRRRSLNIIVLVVCLALLACVAGLFVGCTSTVTPKIVVPTQASYSGNTRNSGLISHSAQGWVVDGNFRARYNALIATYGAEYSLKTDAGMSKVADGATPDQERWLIDRQHFDLMLTMNVKKHSGILPTK